ncbi:ROK family protein [Paenibacillus athensensis]|nr:ROK family protein [Paenibacillus athensensis]MCD1261761.1 ROK family protein [Paenibacillus athensensis]
MAKPMADETAELAVGVDVGGTKIHAALVDRTGAIRRRLRIATQAADGRAAERIMEAIARLLAETPDDSVRLRGIGIGTAGQVDWQRGAVRFASDLLPGYTGTPLRDIATRRFGLPVWVDNDVNVLALAEQNLGAGRGSRHMVCLAIGTGIGGAVVSGGKLLRGCWGGAGELGHLSVRFDGQPCRCGGTGCLELYASGTGIAEQMQRKLAEAGVTDRPARIGAREVIAGWRSGEPLAQAVLEQAFAALGAATASLIHTFNPEVVVVGGGVAEAGADFLQRIREETLQRTMPALHERVSIVGAAHGNDGAVIGAALLAWEETKKEEEVR